MLPERESCRCDSSLLSEDDREVVTRYLDTGDMYGIAVFIEDRSYSGDISIPIIFEIWRSGRDNEMFQVIKFVTYLDISRVLFDSESIIKSLVYLIQKSVPSEICESFVYDLYAMAYKFALDLAIEVDIIIVNQEDHRRLKLVAREFIDIAKEVSVVMQSLNPSRMDNYRVN